MRDLHELNLNVGGAPVLRPAPTSDQIQAYQDHFGVVVTPEHLALLHRSNGGHPELDTVVGLDGEPWSVNAFYHLSDDRASASSLWSATATWQQFLRPGTIPFAGDSGGNQFVIDASDPSTQIKLLIHETLELRPVSRSFEGFLDALRADPEDI